MLPRRKRHIRILIFLLILLSILLYVSYLFKASYLFLVIFGLPTSSSITSLSPIVTWEIPGFAYYNNQLLLHFGTIAYMPANTQFLSPDFRIPSLRGINGSMMPINELFDQNKLKEIHVIDQQSLKDKNLKTMHTAWIRIALDWLSTTKDLNFMNRTIVNITNDENYKGIEDLWKTMFTRLIIRVFFLNKKNDITHVARSFKYINFVPSCVSLILNKYPNITQAIGIHLRTWAADLSLGSISSRECTIINGKNPLNLFFQCQLLSSNDLNKIISSIQRIELSSIQPIYIATDNHQSPLVLELKQHYAHRLINTNETCSQNNIFAPMIENELLTRTQSFIGSFFSTFSLVVAIRRDLHQSYFIQTKMQYYIYQYLILIVILFFLFFCYFFVKSLRFFLRIL